MDQDGVPDRDVIAANVVRLRKSAGMSQNVLASAMRDHGHSAWRQTTVSRVERGVQELRMGEMRALSRILGEGVLAGTKLAATAQEIVAALPKLNVQRALRDAEENLKTALTEVRRAKKLVDLHFGKSDDSSS